MTREDLDRIAQEYFDDRETEFEMDEVFDLAKKAIEERKEDILDKISAEIADIYCGQYCENPLTADAVREMALEIIDKYKAESEDKE